MNTAVRVLKAKGHGLKSSDYGLGQAGKTSTSCLKVFEPTKE